MRTPNTECFLCTKPLYRRPSDTAKARYAACMSCRSDAQKVAGVTDRQQTGLAQGRTKGTNHRTGYRHREASKAKTAVANKEFWAANPDKAIARGVRGEDHYRWNGGISKVNLSIRRMTENRKWMDAVKSRDGHCLRCGSTEHLESHHKRSLAELMADLAIQSRDDARRHAATIWDLSNGETLCEPCHYKEHGRTRNADR